MELKSRTDNMTHEEAVKRANEVRGDREGIAEWADGRPF